MRSIFTMHNIFVLTRVAEISFRYSINDQSAELILLLYIRNDVAYSGHHGRTTVHEEMKQKRGQRGH